MKQEEKDKMRIEFLKNKKSNFTLKELEFLTLLNTPSLEIPDIGRHFSTENILNEICDLCNKSKSHEPYVSGTLILEALEYNVKRPDYITSFSELKSGDILVITTKDTKLELDIFEGKETFVFKPCLPLSFIFEKIQVYNNITKTFSKFTINCSWIMDKFKREKFFDARHNIVINNNCSIRIDSSGICIYK
jgi:hypothetical protein